MDVTLYWLAHRYPTCPDSLDMKGIVRRQVFAAFAANLGAFSFGTAWAFPATALPSMRSDPTLPTPVTMTAESLITSLLFVGCIIASPINGYCIDKFGRRMTMLITNIPCFLSWLIISYSSNLNWIYVGRVITGICSASYGSAAPLFISEISHPLIRGKLVCSFDTMIAAGMVFANIVGSLFPSWRIQAVICSFVPLLTHILLLFCHETPRYLLTKRKERKAKESYLWYNPSVGDYEGTKTLLEISEGCEKDRLERSLYGWRVMFEGEVMKPILIGVLLMFFHLFSGNYPILAYGMGAIENQEASSSSSYSFLGITLMNTAQFVFTIIPVLFVDSIGRRPLLIISELMMALTLGSLGAVLLLSPNDHSPLHQTFSIFILVVYEIFYALGVGPLPWLLVGEIVSPKKPGMSIAIITGFYRVVGSLELFYFHPLVSVIGHGGVFILFAMCSLVGGVVCYFIIPDTTGKSLQDLRNAYT